MDKSKGGLSLVEKRRLVSSFGKLVILFVFFIWWWWYLHDNAERTQGNIYMMCVYECSEAENPGQMFRTYGDNEKNMETQEKQANCVYQCDREYKASMVEINPGLLKYYPPNYIKPMESARYFW